MDPRSHRPVRVTAVDGDATAGRHDTVAVEEPLELRVAAGDRLSHVATTMRTPGDDLALAVGFLYAEGIVTTPADVVDVSYCLDPVGDDDARRGAPGEVQRRNVVTVRLAGETLPDLGHLARHGTVTSACGVCGRSTIEGLRLVGATPVDDRTAIDAAVLTALPDRLRAAQELFASTGGLHAAARFGPSGELVDVREDVGRHNALDKLVGAAVRRAEVPWEGQLLLLSGRASYELLQKALAVRVPVVAAVGAPSSLAVDLAGEFGITLVGFLRGHRFNIYTHPERIAGAVPLAEVPADQQGA